MTMNDALSHIVKVPYDIDAATCELMRLDTTSNINSLVFDKAKKAYHTYQKAIDVKLQEMLNDGIPLTSISLEISNGSNCTTILVEGTPCYKFTFSFDTHFEKF